MREERKREKEINRQRKNKRQWPIELSHEKRKTQRLLKNLLDFQKQRHHLVYYRLNIILIMSSN